MVLPHFYIQSCCDVQNSLSRYSSLHHRDGTSYHTLYNQQKLFFAKTFLRLAHTFYHTQITMLVYSGHNGICSTLQVNEHTVSSPHRHTHRASTMSAKELYVLLMETWHSRLQLHVYRLLHSTKTHNAVMQQCQD